MYRLASAEKARTPISIACELLGVSRSGYYDWARRAPSDRALSDTWLSEKIKQIHAENRQVYGAPRIHAELRMQHNIRVSRKRVERLMRQAGISGLVARKRGKTTIRVPGVRVAGRGHLRWPHRGRGATSDVHTHAVAESFFVTLKKELVHRQSWPTRRELTGEVFEYIEAFYNPIRRHSTLGMLSPIQYEDQTLALTTNP